MITTDDTAVRVAMMPDWREGVTLTQAFETSVQRSRRGQDQTASRRKSAIYRMEYTRTGLTPAECRDRLAAIRAESRSPLIIPLWPDGIPLQTSMIGVGSASLDSNPIDGEWVAPMDVFIWSDALGGQWRTVTAISGRNLTFSGTGTLYLAGALVFPGRRMVREISEGMLTGVDVASGTEQHRYRTI